MTCRWIRIGYAPVMAARITYLGELGWELHVPTEFVAMSTRPCAPPARLRVSRMPAQGDQQPAEGKALSPLERDISPDETPFEAGLGLCGIA